MIAMLLKTIPAADHAVGRRRRAANVIERLRSAERPAQPVLEKTGLTVADRLEIQALLTDEATLAERRATKAQQAIHQVTNVQITRAGTDRATATAVLVVHAAKDGRRTTYVDFVGKLEDEFVRTPAGWRASARRLVHLADA